MTRLSNLADGLRCDNDLPRPQLDLVLDVLAAVDAVVDDLVGMDLDTAVDLSRWPVARHLVHLAEPVAVDLRTTGGRL